MKVEYDVKVPRNQYGKGKWATIFYNFYDGEHTTAKYSFKTTEEAKRLYKSAYDIISRNCLCGVRATMMGNEVYFEKYKV